MSLIKIITTSDGSHSLLNEKLNETYHSVHGAIQESSHVFIQRGLEFYINRMNPVSISLLEVGFGTGLNALLTLQHNIDAKIDIRYTSLEPFPVEEEIWSMLNYTSTIGYEEHFRQMHGSDWNRPQRITPGFEFTKLNIALQESTELSGAYDLVYFDAFAPSKQPEMWRLPVLQRIVQCMNANAVFVTYCAKGQLKRDLKALGLTVETLEGPPGKHEMVRATKSATM